jgi:hypothetical protein
MHDCGVSLHVLIPSYYSSLRFRMCAFALRWTLYWGGLAAIIRLHG